jgi:hypothetical protein
MQVMVNSEASHRVCSLTWRSHALQYAVQNQRDEGSYWANVYHKGDNTGMMPYVSTTRRKGSEEEGLHRRLG